METGTVTPYAPFIVEVVGDVERPRAALPAVDAYGHLPGSRKPLAGFWYLLDGALRGDAHFVDLVRRHGKVFRYALGPIPCVAVADPDLAMRIARNEDGVWSSAIAWRAFFDGINPRSATLDMPGSFDFAHHRDARRLLAPAFSPAAVARYTELALPIFERVVGTWIGRGRVDAKVGIRRLFALVAGRIFLGVEDDRRAELFDEALAAYWRAPTAVVKDPRLSPTWRRGISAYAKLFDSLRPEVERRRALGGDDLFSRLCATAGEIEWMDDDTLVRLFLGVMTAAFDTTSLAVTSLAHLLATHPDVQERLRDEARTVAPGRPTAEDTRRMELADRAFKETLRLYPVAPYFPRRALVDVDLGGHRIPAGSMVVVLVAAMMKDGSIYTRPEAFDPDRFAPERAEDRRHRGAYLPFGGGAHACLGAQLSTIEAKAFWHVLLTRARFRLERPYEGVHRMTPLGCVSGDVALRFEPLSR